MLIIKTDLDIINVFENAVKSYPNRIALRDEYGEVSYSELSDIVDKKAYFLKKLSIWHQDIYVAIDLPKSRMAVIMLLAVYKAEGVIIPLPVECPYDRVNNILSQTKAEIVITDKDIDYNVFCLNPYKMKETFGDIAAVQHSPRSNSFAYIMFTSGSTGEPKGIMIRQKSIVNEVTACYKRFFGLDENTKSLEIQRPLVIAILADFSFDPSIVQLFMGLFYGNCIVPVPDDVKKSQWKLSEFLSRMRVDCLDITPSHLRQILSFYDNKKEELYLPQNIISVGEPLTVELMKWIAEFNKTEYVINAYGPTEVCVYCTAKRFKLDEFNIANDIPIGRPLDGYEVYILDEKGDKVENGRIGEICVASPYISDGYIGKEKLTKKAFVFLPGISEHRIYRTNDLGVLGRNGDFYCKGRQDDQIKILGNRIEIGEVENTIKRYVDVQQIKVMVVKDSLVEKKMIAFYSGDKKSKAEFINKLKQFLPNAMIPTVFINIRQFPLNNNGKIDRKKLLETYNINENITKDSSIRSIIGNILRIPDISYDDNIFDLGATSLDIFVFSTEIYNKYGVMIDNNKLRECRNIREITKEVTKLSKNVLIKEIKGNELELCNDFVKKIIRNESKNRKLNKTKSRWPEYNVIFKVKFAEKLSDAKIKESMKELAERHRILRSRFVIRNHDIYLESTDDCNIDFMHISSDEDYSLVDIIRHFQYDQVPLYQIIMIDKKDNTQEIIFNFHHSIVDRISMEIYINELLILYNGLNLPSNKIDYFEYKKQCKSYGYAEIKAFWTQYLKDRHKAVCFNGSGGNKRCKVTIQETYNSIRIILKDSFYDAINRLIKKYKMNAFSFFALCMAYSLYKETGENDILFGGIFHGRSYHIPGSANVIGMLAKLLPIRCTFCESNSLSQMLVDIKQNVESVIDNQNVELSDFYYVQSFEDRLKGALFKIIINYSGNFRINKEFLVKKIEYEEISENFGSIPLYLYISKEQNCFTLDFKYATSIFTEKDIQSIQKKYIDNISDFLTMDK